jgi:hypothetical protein
MFKKELKNTEEVQDEINFYDYFIVEKRSEIKEDSDEESS